MIRTFSTGALALALLGLLEAISMGKALAAQTKQKLNMNQQCLSESVANIAGSFFHCGMNFDAESPGSSRWSWMATAADMPPTIALAREAVPCLVSVVLPSAYHS